jgi:hypothetical protein
MTRSNLIFLCATASLLLFSCGDGDGERQDDMDQADSVRTEDKTVPANETFFQVPSPGEMLTFIKMVGGKNNRNVSFLNPPANEKTYTDSKTRALNFGIYSCDLSYCSIFEIGTEAVKYFKVVKEMGEQIGISTAIKPEILKRLEQNIGKPDSLAVITDDVYFSSFEALEGSQQGPTLALVVAGGWIESIYIAAQLATYQENSAVIERLADQKYTLENLIEFLKKHESNESVASVRKDFDGLLSEFNKVTEVDVKQDSKGGSDKVVMQGGKQLVVSEETYKNIVAKVTELRNKYTQSK